MAESYAPPPQMGAVQTPYNAFQTEPTVSAPAQVKRSKLGKGAKIAIILSVSVLVLLVGGFFTARAIIESGKSSDYENACRYLDDGIYAKALEMFETLGDYRDSAELAGLCVENMNYYDATRLMDKGELTEALAAFKALGSFKDSEKKAEECQNILDYEKALGFMENGDFTGAGALFKKLGNYKDSVTLATECDNMINYNEGIMLIEEGNYSDALVILEPLADIAFEDSVTLVIECTNRLDYLQALAYMDAGNYDKASALFEFLAEWEFEDCVELLAECRNWIVYNEATGLIDSGSYTAAIVKLNPLVALDFEDSEALRTECYDIMYASAEEAYSAGKYYTASLLFLSISEYDDAAERAENCARNYPSTGETYRNSNYSGRAVTLKIVTPRDDERPTFAKIYTAEGTHVSSLFIRSGASPSIRLPADTYMIKTAYGDTWYGPEEMFGDVGAVYQTLLFDSGTTYRFQRNYTYTLTLRSSGDGNVGAQNENRSGF